MPKNKATTATKFDPRKGKTTKPPVTKPETPDSKPVETPEQAQPVVSNDVLTLVSKLTEQISSLTAQVDKLSNDQTKIEDNVKTFKKESAEQRQVSLAGVSKTRISKKAVMKALWDKQVRVQMLAPFEGSEKKGSRLPVQANGYSYVHKDGKVGIPKGIYTSVPKGVFDIASNSLNQQIENMGFDNRIDQRETNSEGAKFDPQRLER